MMGRNWDYDGWNMMGGGSVLAGILMFVFGLMVLVGIVLLIIWAVRASNGHGGHGGYGGHRYAGGPDNRPGPLPPTGPGADEAIAVARRRFAAGEITQEEFAQIMSSLSR